MGYATCVAYTSADECEFARADAGIFEPETDSELQRIIDNICESAGRAERAIASGDNAAARDIMVSAARELLEELS